MVNRKAFVLLILLFTNVLAFTQEAENQEKKLSQKIEWEADPYASEYRIEVRDSKKEIIVEQKTKRTNLTLNLTAGNYSYRIHAYDLFGRSASSTEWIPLKIEKAIRPRVLKFVDESISLRKGTPLTIRVLAKGILSSSKIEIIGNDGKVYAGRILTIDELEEKDFKVSELKDDKEYVYHLFFNSTNISEGKYKLSVKNSGGLSDSNKTFSVGYAVNPVIINFEPSTLYVIKGAEGTVKVTGEGFYEGVEFELESTDGLYKTACEIKSSKIKNGKGELTLTFNTNKGGRFNINVKSKEGLTDSSGIFMVEHTIKPHILRVWDGQFTLSSLGDFKVVFDASGIMENTSVRLVSIPDGKKSLMCHKILKNDKDLYEAYFQSAALNNGKYTLLVENAGNASDVDGEFDLIVRSGVDVNIGGGIYSGTINLLYNDTLPDRSYGTFTLGLLTQVSVVPLKFRLGYFGLGFTGEFTTWVRDSDLFLQSGNITLEAIYQKPFYDEKLRFQIVAGGGLGIFGSTRGELSKDFTQSPILRFGVSGLYYPVQHLYFELGMDFYHVFSDIPVGLFVPHFSLGGKL